MWQITINELVHDSYQPKGINDRVSGLTRWFCPVCDTVVGLYSTGTVHDKGWLIKRDQCRNGHNIDWEGID